MEPIICAGPMEPIGPIICAGEGAMEVSGIGDGRTGFAASALAAAAA